MMTMPSYDEDQPTDEEELLLKQLVNQVEQQQRIQTLIQVDFIKLNDERIHWCCCCCCFS